MVVSGLIQEASLAQVQMVAKRLDPSEMDADQKLDTDLQRRFGSNFKTIRIELGLTQRQVSNLSDIDQSEVSKVESGSINLTIRQMRRLANVIDRDVSILLAERSKTRKKMSD